MVVVWRRLLLTSENGQVKHFDPRIKLRAGLVMTKGRVRAVVNYIPPLLGVNA